MSIRKSKNQQAIEQIAQNDSSNNNIKFVIRNCFTNEYSVSNRPIDDDTNETVNMFCNGKELEPKDWQWKN